MAAPSPVPDKRRARRFAMVAPICWDGGKGITEDMSTSGIFFVTARPLPPGARVAVTVVLQEQAMHMLGVGRVVRVAPRGAGYGIGLHLQRSRVVPVAPGIATGQQN